MTTKTLSIRLSVEEAQQAVAWLEKYGDTSERVTKKIRAAMAPDAGITKKAAEQIRALYLPAEAAAQKFERARENITKAQTAGILADKEAAEAIARVRAEYERTIEKINGTDEARKQAEKAARETAKEDEKSAKALEALRLEYDQTYAATQRYNQALEKISQAKSLGILDDAGAAEQEKRARSEYEKTIARLNGATQAEEDRRRAIESVRATYLPLDAAERRRAKALEDISAAAQAGALSDEEVATAQKRVQSEYQRTVDRINAAEAANNEVAQAEARARAEAERHAAELEALKLRYDPLQEAQARYERSLQDIARAREAGVISEERAAVAERAASAEYERTTAKIRDAETGASALAKQQEEAALAAKKHAEEMERLRRSFDPVYAAQARYREAIAKVNKAREESVITDDQAAVAERKIQQELEETIDRIKKAEDAEYNKAIATEAARKTLLPTVAAQKQYEESIKNINEQLRSGNITTEEATTARERALYVYNQTIERISREDAAMRGQTRTMRLQSHELANLNAQFSDIFQSLFLGLPPLQILLQQGPQIVQIYGGVGNTFKQLTSVLTASRVALGGTTAALGIGLLSLRSYLTSIKAVETAAAGIGRGMAGSSGQMEDAARAGADAANISISAARSMEVAFLRTGAIGSELFGSLIAISKDFAVTMGIESSEAGAALSDMFADPEAAANQLWKQYGLLDGATARYVTQLAQQGRLLDAQAVLLAALPKRLADATDATTALGAAWSRVSTAASNAWQWMGRSIDRVISGPATIEDQIAELQKLLEMPTSPVFLPESVKDEARRQILELQAQLEADAEEAQRRANARLGSIASGIAQESPASSRRREIERLKNEIAALNAGLVDTGLDSVQISDINKAIEAKTNLVAGLEQKQARLNEINEIDARISNEINPLIRAELEARRTRLNLAGEEITTAEAESQALRERQRIILETLSASDRQIDDISAEMSLRSGLTAQIAAGNLTQDDANRILQEEVALRPLVLAAATAEGDERARLKDIVDQTRAAYAGAANAQRMMAATSNIVDLTSESAIRARLNVEIERGTVTQDEANRVLKEELQLRPFVIAAATQEGAAKVALLRVIQRIRDESGALQRLELSSDASAQIAEIRSEVGLREKLSAAIESGTIKTEDANQALQNEVSLRPLLLAAMNAQGQEQEDLLALIQRLRGAYQDLAVSERNLTRSTGWRAYVDNMARANEQLKVERALLGANNMDRARGLALLDAENEIRNQKIDPSSDRAKQIRLETVALAEQREELNRQSKAWDNVKSVGEDAIDSLVESLATGDFSSFGQDLGKQLTSQIYQLGIGNPLKNAMFGTDYATMPDLGGIADMFDRMFGGTDVVANAASAIDPAISAAAASMSTPLMNVTAGSVTVAGGGITGAAGPAIAGGATEQVTEAADSAAASISNLADASSDGTKGLGIFGKGLDFIGNNLSSLFNGAGSFISSLFSSAPAFASGGVHRGGLRWVGERGPEIEYTGPSTILPADLSRKLMEESKSTTVINNVQAQSASRDSGPLVVIQNYGSEKVREKTITNSAGQRQTIVTIGEQVGAALAQPGNPARRTMETTYNVRPTGRER